MTTAKTRVQIIAFASRHQIIHHNCDFSGIQLLERHPVVSRGS